MQSVFGTLADPFADKLLVLGSLAALASAGRVPVWVVAVIAAREVWVTLLRAYAKRSGVVIAAGPLGKAKMVVQVFTSCSPLIAFDLTGAALHVPLYVMVAITDRLRRRDRAARAPAARAPVPRARHASSPARASALERGGARAPRPLDTAAYAPLRIRPKLRSSAYAWRRTRRLESPLVTPDAATPHSPLGLARLGAGAAEC